MPPKLSRPLPPIPSNDEGLPPPNGPGLPMRHGSDTTAARRNLFPAQRSASAASPPNSFPPDRGDVGGRGRAYGPSPQGPRGPRGLTFSSSGSSLQQNPIGRGRAASSPQQVLQPARTHRDGAIAQRSHFSGGQNRIPSFGTPASGPSSSDSQTPAFGRPTDFTRNESSQVLGNSHPAEHLHDQNSRVVSSGQPSGNPHISNSQFPASSQPPGGPYNGSTQFPAHEQPVRGSQVRDSRVANSITPTGLETGYSHGNTSAAGQRLPTSTSGQSISSLQPGSGAGFVINQEHQESFRRSFAHILPPNIQIFCSLTTWDIPTGVLFQHGASTILVALGSNFTIRRITSPESVQELRVILGEHTFDAAVSQEKIAMAPEEETTILFNGSIGRTIRVENMHRYGILEGNIWYNQPCPCQRCADNRDAGRLDGPDDEETREEAEEEDIAALLCARGRINPFASFRDADILPLIQVYSASMPVGSTIEAALRDRSKLTGNFILASGERSFVVFGHSNTGYQIAFPGKLKDILVVASRSSVQHALNSKNLILAGDFCEGLVDEETTLLLSRRGRAATVGGQGSQIVQTRRTANSFGG